MSNVKKVDKGFELIYWKLSYRRKFIRTLWTIPFSIFAIALTILCDWSMKNVVAVAIILLIIASSQLIYTYKKSKNEKELE